MTSDCNLAKEVENLLINEGSEQAGLLRVLDLVLAHFNCSVGTIHGLDAKSGLLTLVVQRGMPEAITEKVSRIPIGKGMAGLAAERKQPVQICNLQTDTSGVAKQGAKETRMEGSVAVPMLVEKDVLRGVLGVAKPVPYEFPEAELELLKQIASLIGKLLGGRTRREVLDQYFIEARFKLIEVAAFLDRLDRADGEGDYRIKAFREAVKELERSEPERARRILLSFSDPTVAPIPEARGKSAAGAWAGEE